MRRYEQGQVLMIIILVMTVALTIGLSVAARTVSSLRTSAEEKSSEQAFSAAEAGIEQSIAGNSALNGSFTNNTNFQTSLSTLSGTTFLMNNGELILKDDAADLWLANYPKYTNTWTGNLTIYWGSSTDQCQNSETGNTMAALDIILLTGSKNNPVLSHYALDPCASRAAYNHFTTINGTGGTVQGKTFAYKQTLTITNGLLARIVPLYAPTFIGVTGCDGINNNCTQLASQGTVIQSVGSANSAQRKIVYFQSYPKVPDELFQFSVFSPK